MKYLLDSCVYFWIITNNQEKLTQKIKDLYLDESNEIFISIISQLEITIKHNKNPIKGLTKPVIYYFDELRKKSDIKLLDLSQSDIENMKNLPKIHLDPFDRVLISQAQNNKLTIVTPDSKIKKYDVRSEF